MYKYGKTNERFEATKKNTTKRRNTRREQERRHKERYESVRTCGLVLDAERRAGKQSTSFVHSYVQLKASRYGDLCVKKRRKKRERA